MSDNNGNGVKDMCNFSEALIEEGREREEIREKQKYF